MLGLQSLFLSFNLVRSETTDDHAFGEVDDAVDDKGGGIGEGIVELASPAV